MTDTDVRTEQTGAPTDLTGGMPATAGVDDALELDQADRDTFAAIADHLIPAAHGMPSAAAVVTSDRVRFVLSSRPDLMDPLKAALRLELGTNVAVRLAKLADEPTNLAALQLAIVGGYYTDERVRELIGYPGQLAIEFDPNEAPPYVSEGLIDKVIERGPVWRDPATGKRAAAPAEMPEGERDGRDGN